METKEGVRVLYLSRLLPEALGGYPVPNGAGGVDLLPPSEVIDAAGAGVLVFDELTCASPDMFAAVMAAVLDRVIAGRRYDFYPVGLCNPPEMAANGAALPLPLLNRCAVRQVGVREWIEWAQTGDSPISGLVERYRALDLPLIIEGPPGVGKSAALVSPRGGGAERLALQSSGVLEFLRECPEQALSLPDAGHTVAWPSPRSWTRAALALTAGANGDILPDIVGAASAASFLEWAASHLARRYERMSESERLDSAIRWAMAANEGSVLSDYPDSEWLDSEPARKRAVLAALQGRAR